MLIKKKEKKTVANASSPFSCVEKSTLAISLGKHQDCVGNFKAGNGTEQLMTTLNVRFRDVFNINRRTVPLKVVAMAYGYGP